MTIHHASFSHSVLALVSLNVRFAMTTFINLSNISINTPHLSVHTQYYSTVIVLQHTVTPLLLICPFKYVFKISDSIEFQLNGSKIWNS